MVCMPCEGRHKWRKNCSAIREYEEQHRESHGCCCPTHPDRTGIDHGCQQGHPCFQELEHAHLTGGLMLASHVCRCILAGWRIVGRILTHVKPNGWPWPWLSVYKTKTNPAGCTCAHPPNISPCKVHLHLACCSPSPNHRGGSKPRDSLHPSGSSGGLSSHVAGLTAAAGFVMGMSQTT